MPSDGDFSINSGCGDKRPGRIIAALMTMVAWMFGGHR